MSRSIGRGSFFPRRSTPRGPPPQTDNRARASSGGLSGGSGSTTGQDRALNAILGPHRRYTHNVELPLASLVDACQADSQAFRDCLDNNGSDTSICQLYLDQLNHCRTNNKPGGTIGNLGA